SILLALRRGGFLESKVGSGGGYRLARPPRQIAVGDIIRRLEGRLTVREGAGREGGAGGGGIPASELPPGKIAVNYVNKQLTDATDDVLNSITLEQLLDYVNKT